MAGRCRERRYADHFDESHIYLDILQNAPLRSQISKIFFASGGKGVLTPLTKSCYHAVTSHKRHNVLTFSPASA